MTFAFTWMAVAHIAAAQPQSAMKVPACRSAEVTLQTTTPGVKAGTLPEFSAIVRNNSARAIRVLDVRHGRRPDLQDNYFELFIVARRRVIDLPSAISDPGPISDADYTVLEPGERLEIHPLSYTRSADRLPPGKYSAFIVFWQAPHTLRSQCRSSEASFEVSD